MREKYLSGSASRFGSRTYDHPVVVTGGAGALGSALVKLLLEGGCPDVRVVDLHPCSGMEKCVRSFPIDIREDDFHTPLADAKTVFHLAECRDRSQHANAKSRIPFFSVNVDGTRRLLDAADANGIERFVFVSSALVYGIPQQLPLREDHPTVPTGPYGQSKLEAEKYVEVAHRRQLDTAIVRPGRIVGPGHVDVVTRVFDGVLGNKPIVLMGDGYNRYELTAAFDVANLVFRAGLARGHAVYNASSANVPTMREWIARVIEQAGSRSRIIGFPGSFKLALRLLEKAHTSLLHRDRYEMSHLDYYLNATRAREELGWTPRYSSLDAILGAFRWYTSNVNAHSSRLTRNRAR